MTLSPVIIVEVARLLAETDLSRRDIALRTGVSRATVSSIALGKHPVARGKHPVARGKPAREVCVAGPVDRCPGCGGNSRISPETGDCFACQIRRRGGKATMPGADESTELALGGEHLERYEVVRLAARRRRLARSRVDKPPGPQ